MRIISPVPFIAREVQEDFVYRKSKVKFKSNTNEIYRKRIVN
jgi:hypothetical protein